MRFTIAAALAFATTAFAQTAGFDAMTTPAQNENVPAGETYTIVWQQGTYTTGTVTLSLLGGETAATLVDLGSFASGVDNAAGSYTWAVDSSLGSAATYGIKITLDSDSSVFQYSFPFHITAGSSSTSSSVSAAGYPTAAAPSSSSSSSAASTYAASAPTVTASVSSTVVASVSSSSSFPSFTPSGTAGVSGIATGTGISTVRSSSTGSASSTATPVTTNGAPRAAVGVTGFLGLVAAIFML